ncbi:zinc finger MYM-type 1-like [Pelobates cultripes]|uniref:Zinc finger MYM-type 1-like n=1 Tax=Pelobates cultripes TaxID=61616 RepID=A0AAD1T5D7_PELCU|nr:zinc finger MYM-type 1-like [Pelobates cultripes]
MIKEDIVKEVNNAGMFSVQMDSTQDVSAHDQCAIVVRYVVEDKERLVRLLNVEDSSSKGLHDLLRDSLSDIGLHLEQCIGDSFDGAANMCGTYTGLQALMTEVRPSHIHTWCYAHVLNLVICDASSVCVPAVSLFGLLGNLSTFFSESYKRIKIWEDQLKAKTGRAKLKRLDKIGTTRWSSKARALRKLCGTYENHSEELYSDLILVLKHVSSSSDFINSVRHEALKLNENLCKFETILAAFTFIRIFDITTPVSDYLQSPALDIMQAWRMVEDATNHLSKISRDFSGVCGSATTFIDHLNEKLAAEDIAISKSFTEHRSTRCVVPANQQHSFEVSCYNVICDKVLESMRTRFATHGKLYMQISCFDPNRFEEILASPEKIKFDAISTAVPEIDGPVLREELISFASSYRNLSRGLFDSDDETLSSAGEEEPDFSDSEPSAYKAKERLVRLLNVEDSSSKGLHDLLRDSLSDIGLNLEQCIGDSFDGAANMSGTYTGLQALMTEVCPSHIHTWCHAHVLNLVICDASSVCVPAVSLFGLLGNLSTFFSESYKRIKIWEDQLKAKTGSAKLKRLDKIGTTRWSSKARALRKLCGTYENHSEELYSDLILVLKHVSSSSDFRNSVRHEALKLNENLCKFETILATFTFIRIFDITTPVSDYLQSPALDIMQAWRMVEDATNRLSKISRDFSGVCGSATTFIDHLNEKLAAEDIAISKSFTEHRSTRCVVPANQQHSFEVSCYNVICDKVLESMRTRFATHGKLYMQISCFDPNRFEEILASPEKIKFDAISTAVPEIDGPVLREELISFASSYRNLSRGLFDSDDETLSSAGEEEPDFSDSEPSACKPSMKKLCCQKCTSCAFKLLFQYRLCSSAYENLYMAYKYLITLSTTQCSCERCFSKLKILKSRLRSTLTQQNLETLMLIAIEKDVSLSIKRDKEKIIDRFGKTSAELRSLLLF